MTSRSAIAEYLNRVRELLTPDLIDQIHSAAEILVSASYRNSSIFIIGNGGSASTASHMATDLGTGSLDTHPLRAIALTDNSAVLTAAGNDHGFDSVFVRQLELLGRSGDVLIAISASGNSPNILAALERARQLNIVSIGLSGFDGGLLLGAVDVPIHVPTRAGEYGPVEDVHLVVNHALTTAVRGAQPNLHS
jgi:D-sedoheptulose 7-phosphate isomerase